MFFPNFRLNLGLGTSFISLADKLDRPHGCNQGHPKWGEISPKAGAEEGMNDE